MPSVKAHNRMMFGISSLVPVVEDFMRCVNAFDDEWLDRPDLYIKPSWVKKDRNCKKGKHVFVAESSPGFCTRCGAVDHLCKFCGAVVCAVCD